MTEYNLDITEQSKWLMAPQSETAKTFPFHITEIGDFYAQKDYFVERDSKKDFQLIYTLEGEGFFSTSEQSLKLCPGSCILIHCDVHHRYETLTPIWRNRWIHLGGSGAEAYAEYINAVSVSGVQYSVTGITEHNHFDRIFNQLEKLVDERGIIPSAQVSSYISEMMTSLLSSHLSPQKTNSSSRVEDILRSADFIRRHCSEDLNLDKLCEKARFSKFHFVRLFKKQFGQAPYEYLTSCRIDKAKLLLRSTDLGLDEIAEKTGYKSKSNFIARFKTLNGTTPIEYRKDSLSMKK